MQPDCVLSSVCLALTGDSSGAAGLVKFRERKGSCAGNPRGFEKDISDKGINEFLNEFPPVNLISLSREKVTLTFATLNVRHEL